MKFAEVIREAGFDTQKFPKCSELSIKFFDGKNREDTSETIKFVEPLFAHSKKSHDMFEAYLTYLEEKLKGGDVISDINVQVSIDVVTVKTSSSVQYFFRHS